MAHNHRMQGIADPYINQRNDMKALNSRMKAREESLGEASDYDTEAKYAAQYRSSLDEPPVDEETYRNHWGSIQEQMADSYRRGY